MREAHVSIFDIDNYWTFAMMKSFTSFVQMGCDHKSAWQQFYKMQRDNDR